MNDIRNMTFYEFIIIESSKKLLGLSDYADFGWITQILKSQLSV